MTLYSLITGPTLAVLPLSFLVAVGAALGCAGCAKLLDVLVGRVRGRAVRA